MSSTSSESVTPHGDTVTDEEVRSIEFILALKAAATAGRRLLEAADSAFDPDNDLQEFDAAMIATRAAYDRLDEIQHRAAT